MAAATYTMRMVTKKTGLSAHVVRAWERRYQAVKPHRTITNRRTYSEADVERLRLLAQATSAGHNISEAVRHSNAELAKLLAREDMAPVAPVVSVTPMHSGAEHLQSALAAVRKLDAHGLDQALQRAILDLGTQGLLVKVASPLSQTVGELWHAGQITAAHEHFLTAALRTFLSRHSQQYLVRHSAPVLVVATPSGQYHELGAVLVAASAASAGWRVVYLGSSLPAAEIASAAIAQNARAVALSIVYPDDDPTLDGELRMLRKYLPEPIAVIAGGRAVNAYEETLRETHAVLLNRLEDLPAKLDAFRGANARRSVAAQTGIRTSS